MFNLGYYRMHIKGNVDPKAKIWVANHSNMIDGVAVLIAAGTSSYVAREGSDEIPIAGFFFRMFDTIVVNRKSDESRAECKAKIRNWENDESNPPLLIFPEGTTSYHDHILPFKMGAFTSTQRVQPIILNHHVTRYNTSFGDSKTGPPIFWHLWILLCQFENRCDVEIMPSVVRKENENESDMDFADRTRQVFIDNVERENLVGSLGKSCSFEPKGG